MIGCSVDDLADCNLIDWHEEGMTAKAAAVRAIRFDQGHDE